MPLRLVSNELIKSICSSDNLLWRGNNWHSPQSQQLHHVYVAGPCLCWSSLKFLDELASGRRIIRLSFDFDPITRQVWLTCFTLTDDDKSNGGWNRCYSSCMLCVKIIIQTLHNLWAEVIFNAQRTPSWFRRSLGCGEHSQSSPQLAHIRNLGR